MSQEYLPTRPKWLDDEFIKVCVKNDVRAATLRDIDIEDVGLQYVVPKGENYTSAIIRLTVKGNFGEGTKRQNGALENGKVGEVNGKLNGVNNGKSHENVNSISADTKRYIVKIPHKMSEINAFMVEYGVFIREVEMYMTLYPKFQRILDNAGIATTFSCRALHILPEEDVLVMEDLGAKNYVLGNRIEGADLDECRVLFRKLARLHGSSMKYYQDNSVKNLQSYFFKGMVCEAEDETAKELIDNFFGRTVIQEKVGAMAELIKQRPGYEREYGIIDKIKDFSFDLLLDLFAYKPDNKFNALLHGDCWINNMLFKYDQNGRAQDVMLLDMQCAYYNSIANEFFYFFLSSASNDIRKYHYKCVAKFYFDHLLETLEKVDYKGPKPTLQEFHEELVAKSSIFLIMLCFMLPILKAELSAEAKDRSKSEAISMEGLKKMGDDNFNNPKYIESLFITLDFMRDEGIIDHHYEILRRRNIVNGDN